jgi:hypothetical protein
LNHQLSESFALVVVDILVVGKYHKVDQVGSPRANGQFASCTRRVRARHSHPKRRHKRYWDPEAKVLGTDRRRRRRRFHSSYLARWESSDKVTPRNW